VDSTDFQDIYVTPVVFIWGSPIPHPQEAVERIATGTIRRKRDKIRHRLGSDKDETEWKFHELKAYPAKSIDPFHNNGVEPVCGCPRGRLVDSRPKRTAMRSKTDSAETPTTVPHNIRFNAGLQIRLKLIITALGDNLVKSDGFLVCVAH